MIVKWLRALFFALFIRPLTFFILGLNIRGSSNLPRKGPAIIIANHNSHLDAPVLMSLFPLEILHKLHPVAAADYFLKNKFLSWFSQTIMGIIPFTRKLSHKQKDPLANVKNALHRGEIVILFPEGSRGAPEQMAPLKSGIAHLAKDFPHIPIIPIYLQGLGKALPKGDPFIVPFHVDVAIGAPIPYHSDRTTFMDTVKEKFADLHATISDATAFAKN